MAAPQTTDAIVDAARAAFQREPSPSMATLASVTGLSLRQLYRRFGSRDGLLRALDLESLPTARERILAAAFEQLGRAGLADLSMDELAVQANVSRATLYRLFPGKSVSVSGADRRLFAVGADRTRARVASRWRR